MMLSSDENLKVPGGNRNKGNLLDGGKASTASKVSLGKESAVSIPEESKIKDELEKLAESEEEDELFLSKIEFA